jgi:cytochrome d ubiquinol oxidase subunit I
MEGLWDTTRGAPDDGARMAEHAGRGEPQSHPAHSQRLSDALLERRGPGLKAVPSEDRPYVPIVFFAFRIMVGIGMVLLITAVTGALLLWRGRLYGTRWFQLLAMAVTPLGFLAVLAGWTDEAGRQPSSSTGFCAQMP